MTIEEIRRKLENLEEDVKELCQLLSIEGKEKQIHDFQLQMAESSFWDNQKEANKLVEKLKNLKDDVDGWNNLLNKINDLKDLTDVSDTSLEEELTKETQELEDSLNNFRLRAFFRDKFDKASAYVEINSGAGGTEACDWAQMLFRMYFRWSEDKEFKVRVLDEVRGEEVGFKNVTFLVKGKYAYGYLKSERGVHRLVRISPFDSNKRRHTSFASVAVYPEIEDNVNVDIKTDELKVDTFKAGGHGGQHVNVTDSAVRITHLLTGLVVTCQNERSQYQNKQVALRVLKSKLYELKEMERKKELDKMSGQKRKIEWGSQIRSYILCPYLLVKDHRTNIENHNARAVLDGELDNFIVGYLKKDV